ncbi:hypothetical protein EON83_27520 [bacterium]|nr:MAG: hypothetical protein EON83_27520 [bacterium]
MGLEIVELIMRAEEEFDIEIADSDVEWISTPGALCDLIERKLGHTPSTSPSICPTSRSFYAIRRELMQLGIERKQITPSAPLATLWPRSQRRHNWNALSEALQYELPPLRRSPEWAFIGLLPLGLLPILIATSPQSATLYFTLYALSWWLGTCVTTPFATHAPTEMQSVADLSRHLMPRYYAPNPNYAPGIWHQVRAIIAAELNLSLEQVKRDSDFYRDLGIG